jgi:hypothetical protein
VSWPRIAAGAQSGELNHLEVMGEQRIATRNRFPVKKHDKTIKISKTQPSHDLSISLQCATIRGEGIRGKKVCVSDRSESLDVALVSDRREIPIVNMSKHESVETGDVNVDGVKSGIRVRRRVMVVPFGVHVLSVFR